MFGLDTKMLLIGGGVILTVLVSGYFYIGSLHSEIEKLETDKIVLESANKTLNSTITEMQIEFEKQTRLISNLQSALSNAETKADRFERTLRENDIETEGITNAEELERKANDVTKDIFRDFDAGTSR